VGMKGLKIGETFLSLDELWKEVEKRR
jgi:hypothetical protein